jgi:hypothetical protein
MPRKTVIALALVGSIVAGAPAARSHFVDHPIVFPFAGTIPCAPVFLAVDLCPYNTVGGNLGFSECTNPFPEGSWVDIVTEPAPTPPAGKKMILEFETFPQIDWDSWICDLLSNGSHNGATLAAGANVFGKNCDNLLGPDNPVPVGCKEKAVVPATAGKKYVLRAYNYTDVADDPGVYRWVTV